MSTTQPAQHACLRVVRTQRWMASSRDLATNIGLQMKNERDWHGVRKSLYISLLSTKHLARYSVIIDITGPLHRKQTIIINTSTVRSNCSADA